jgi:hypothetical protein
VKVLSFRHYCRKNAKEDKNNYSEPDELAMIALTACYQDNNSKPLMATMRWREAIAVGIGQKTNNNPITHANLFGSDRYRTITNTKPWIVKNSPMITVINTQPIGRILDPSGRSKKENACKTTKILKPSHFKRKRGNQISQKYKVLRRKASKSGP